MKKLISVLLSMCMLLSFTLTACAAEDTQTENNTTIILKIDSPAMTVNGKDMPIDEQGTVPVIVNGRTLLPVRAVVEQMGGTVAWNGEEKTLDVAPTVMNDRTMLPIRFIAESFKFSVLWDDKAQTVTISKIADETESHKKTLVVYYSATGTTEKVAGYIKDAANADIFKIEPVNEYTSSDLDWTDTSSRVNAEHDDESKRDIELKNTEVPNWTEYDTVFIGYPIWWGIAAWPVSSFVKNNDFSGKTVIPFCTSSSSPLGESGKLLGETAGTGNWQEGMRFRSSVNESDVTSWVRSIN